MYIYIYIYIHIYIYIYIYVYIVEESILVQTFFLRFCVGLAHEPQQQRM